MKGRKTKGEAATPSPKGSVKIKCLKLTMDGIENVTNADARVVKAGPMILHFENHYESMIYDKALT